MPSSVFELPDKNKINLGSIVYKAPEMILNPTLISNYESLQKENPNEALPLLDILSNCINKVHIDLVKEMSSNVIVSGGSSLIPGLPERLYKDLNKLNKPNKFKIISSNYRVERKYR